LTALIAFQVALAAGARLGQAAWGGQHATLPPGLRIATIVPIAIYVLGALVVLRRAGYRAIRLSDKTARRGTWTFGVVLLLSALLNFASQSAWERFLMAPVALVLALLTFTVAWAATPGPKPRPRRWGSRDGTTPVAGAG
jgi:hypothetical protein